MVGAAGRLPQPAAAGGLDHCRRCCWAAQLACQWLVTHAAEEYVRAGLYTGPSIMQGRAMRPCGMQNTSRTDQICEHFFFSFRRNSGFCWAKMIRPSDFCVVFWSNGLKNGRHYYIILLLLVMNEDTTSMAALLLTAHGLPMQASIWSLKLLIFLIQNYTVITE